MKNDVVINILAEITQVNSERIYNHLSLKDDLLLDSMGVITLIVELEAQLNISIQDNDITEDNFATVLSLKNYLQHKLEN